MIKPYLIYNGDTYFALCTMSDYSETLCPISIKEITFLDDVISNTLFGIACTEEISCFNYQIEEKLGMVMDVRLDNTIPNDYHDLFSITTHVNVNEEKEVDILSFDEIEEFIEDYGTHFIFNLLEYLYTVDVSIIFRLFIDINIPSIALNRCPSVYSAFTTFFDDDAMSRFEYSINDGMVMLTLIGWYADVNHAIEPLRALMDRVNVHNSNSNNTIHMTANDCSYSMNSIYTGIGEMEVTLSFDRDMLRKQLFIIFMEIKKLIHDRKVSIKISA